MFDALGFDIPPPFTQHTGREKAERPIHQKAGGNRAAPWNLVSNMKALPLPSREIQDLKLYESKRGQAGVASQRT